MNVAPVLVVLAVIAGEREKLIGRLQDRYGLARDKAERQIDEWLEKYQNI